LIGEYFNLVFSLSAFIVSLLFSLLIYWVVKRKGEDSFTAKFLSGPREFFMWGVLYSITTSIYEVWKLFFDHKFLNISLTVIACAVILFLYYLFVTWIEKRQKKTNKNEDSSP
jgi:glucan phosphoethanolaminetransferase (alkaline phosphatase superfamily)